MVHELAIDPGGKRMASEIRPSGLIGHLHAFRAVAILCIITAHTTAIFLYFHYDFDNPGPDAALVAGINEMVWHNSTIFFAAISGLLFAQVLEDRGWPRFFRNKISNVAMPYAVATLGYVLLAIDFQQYLLPYSGPISEIPTLFLTDLLFSTHNPILWYIPVLLALFALTPMIVWLLRGRHGRLIIWLIIIAPLFISRIWPQASWTNVVFFMGPYAAGIYFGKNYPSYLRWADAHKGWLAAIALLATAAIVLTGNFYEPQMIGDINTFESLSYAQKMALTPLLLLVLRRFDDRVPDWMSTIAHYSFSAYFIHMWLIMAQTWLIDRMAGRLLAPWQYEVLALVATWTTIGATILLVWPVRKIFGRYSRILVGS